MNLPLRSERVIEIQNLALYEYRNTLRVMNSFRGHAPDPQNDYVAHWNNVGALSSHLITPLYYLYWEIRIYFKKRNSIVRLIGA